MTVHVHRLEGCAPSPLAFYLKAIGILRLASEQADSGTRGWWEGDRFQLATSLSDSDLQEFLLREYSPTPLLAPWNGASGFFNTWDKKTGRLRRSKNFNALARIEQLGTIEKRWEDFGKAKVAADRILANVSKRCDVASLSDKDRGNLLIIPDRQSPNDTLEGKSSNLLVADKNDDKPIIQMAMQRTQSHVPFYRSAVIDVGDTKPEYPIMWGSGGNDGAMDFTARYMENLLIALDSSELETSRQWLKGAIWGIGVFNLLAGGEGKVGQFHPFGAGGANLVNGPGSQNDTLLNPWDFVLMLEGAISFTSYASRQFGSNRIGFASPFSVRSCAAAYASASLSDEGTRGEQWMPLWSNPITYKELRQLLAEGRAQLGSKQVQEPLDLARAVARLGTARGITSFQRYGYIERNGQSNLAIPIGKFTVKDQKSGHLSCLDDLDPWLGRLRRELRGQNVSARLVQAERNLLNALFRSTESPEIPHLWQGVLLCLGEVEKIMRTGSGFAAQPVPRLRPEWVAACNDGSAEFRLALCFAMQAEDFRKSGQPIEAIRRHWLPLDQWQTRFATSGNIGSLRLDSKSDVVLEGRRGVDDAIALVERRLVEGSQQSTRYLTLRSAPRVSARMADLSRLLAGQVNLDRVIALATPLMALDHAAWAEQYIPILSSTDSSWPDDAWLAIRLCTLPWPIHLGSSELDIATDPALIRRLAIGDGAAAIEIALRRLGTAGVRCSVRSGSTSPTAARLWGAGLAFPINQSTAQQFLHRLDPSKEPS